MFNLLRKNDNMLNDLCFEIIQKCPNNCIFCSSCAGIDKENMISIEMFKKTIDYLVSNFGVAELSISGGEPLMHQDLFEMITYAKKNNIKTILFTSGIKKKVHMTKTEIILLEKNLRKQYSSYLKEGMEREEYENLIKKLMNRYLECDSKPFDSLNRNDFRILEELGLDKIVFDFQAWDREVYNKIMGTKNLYDLTINSLAAASTTSIETGVHFIPTKINYKEFKDIIEMIEVAGFKSISILNFVPQGRCFENKDELMLNSEELEEFINIYNKEKENFNGNIRVGKHSLNNDKHLCNAGLSKLVIKYDGTVLPCAAFKEYDIKKLNDLGIKTPNIYNELDSIKIYNGTRKEPLCKKLYGFNRSIK